MKYFDAFYQSGENPVFCYRSGLMVYEEQLFGGALVACGWNTAGYPLNVLSNCPSRVNPEDFAEPFAFNLEVNGQSVAYDLKFIDFSVDKTEEDLHAILTLESGRMPLTIKIHTLLDGSQMFSRWLELENHSGEPMHISRLVLMGGGLESRLDEEGSAAYSIGSFESCEWGKEGQFAWRALSEEQTIVDCRFHRDRYRHPLIFLKNETTGAIWFAQIAFSGGCRFAANLFHEQLPVQRKVLHKTHLALSMELCCHAPQLVLKAGEAFILPEVHMGAVQGDLDLAINEMHSHIRQSVLNSKETDPSACLIGCGMGAEHDMSVETSKAFIDQFAKMGGEIFIIDAGWECPPGEEQKWGQYNGINYPDSDRYPNGLSELSDYCHEKGLKFGLWVEMERIGIHSPIFEAHPEWRLKNALGKQDSSYLDLANPAAAEWAEQELARIIEEYKLELLRVDYNGSHKSYYGLRDAESGAKESQPLRQFTAVYQIYRNLKKRFPNVIFENCAGGGGRTDLGMMKAFNHTWVSDWQKMPRSVSITNGMTMALPPERVDRLFAGMGCHEIGGLDAHLRNTMLGHMSLNVVHPAAAGDNSEQLAFIQRSIGLYKNFIRSILPTCKIYHHTPESGKSLVNMMEIAAPDGSRGALTAISHTCSGEQHLKARLKGAKSGKKYRVTFDNEQQSMEIDGYTLRTEGIGILIPCALSSELITYEEIK